MISYRSNGPQRIVCLTEETTETLYLLGEQDPDRRHFRLHLPSQEARQKPKVSAFTSAKIDKILELRPDLVIGFSDLQAAIAQDLIKAGVNVIVFNQRSDRRDIRNHPDAGAHRRRRDRGTPPCRPTPRRMAKLPTLPENFRGGRGSSSKSGMIR